MQSNQRKTLGPATCTALVALVGWIVALAPTAVASSGSPHDKGMARPRNGNDTAAAARSAVAGIGTAIAVFLQRTPHVKAAAYRETLETGQRLLRNLRGTLGGERWDRTTARLLDQLDRGLQSHHSSSSDSVALARQLRAAQSQGAEKLAIAVGALLHTGQTVGGLLLDAVPLNEAVLLQAAGQLRRRAAGNARIKHEIEQGIEHYAHYLTALTGAFALQEARKLLNSLRASRDWQHAQGSVEHALALAETNAVLFASQMWLPTPRVTELAPRSTQEFYAPVLEHVAPVLSEAARDVRSYPAGASPVRRHVLSGLRMVLEPPSLRHSVPPGEATALYQALKGLALQATATGLPSPGATALVIDGLLADPAMKALLGTVDTTLRQQWRAGTHELLSPLTLDTPRLRAVD